MICDMSMASQQLIKENVLPSYVLLTKAQSFHFAVTKLFSGLCYFFHVTLSLLDISNKHEVKLRNIFDEVSSTSLSYLPFYVTFLYLILCCTQQLNSIVISSIWWNEIIENTFKEKYLFSLTLEIVWWMWKQETT